MREVLVLLIFNFAGRFGQSPSRHHFRVFSNRIAHTPNIVMAGLVPAMTKLEIQKMHFVSDRVLPVIIFAFFEKGRRDNPAPTFARLRELRLGEPAFRPGVFWTQKSGYG